MREREDPEGKRLSKQRDTIPVIAWQWSSTFKDNSDYDVAAVGQKYESRRESMYEY